LFVGNEENQEGSSQDPDPEYAAKCHPLDCNLPSGNAFLCLELPVNVVTVHKHFMLIETGGWRPVRWEKCVSQRHSTSIRGL
jgi:hypothetical protein